MKSNFGAPISLKSVVWLLSVALICIFIFSCKNEDENKPREKDIVRKEELFPDRVSNNLAILINYAAENNGRINDSSAVTKIPLLQNIYQKKNFSAIWSSEGRWLPAGDSLTDFIKNSMHYGLFPADYHLKELKGIQHQLESDSLSRKDAALWSRADVLLTDAFLQVAADIKRGRLPFDSTSRKDTLLNFDSIYLSTLDKALQTKTVSAVLHDLEPKLRGYTELKESAKAFVDTTEFREFPYLRYPYTDSVTFFDQVKKRLYDEKMFDSIPATIDTMAFRKILGKYQAARKLKVTGKINENTVRSLNDTNWERFKRIALSLDKYKLMPDTMPTTHVWVNIPSFNLKVIDSDSVVMESKVIVGDTKTRTPELYSEISNFITYPQWTVPYSIVFKEMLPAIQKDVTYLEKQNLIVVDKYDSVLDPEKIDWSKLSKKKFPYQIKQREGDDNSLGVLKFNFRNKYAVYLHDTNARWMFQKSSRALSHGCVRVQDWRDLAHFLVRNDTIKYNIDTLAGWIVRQEKHVVSGFKKVPLFIRYFTTEGSYGKVKFYDDIYGEDKILTEKYFSKNIN
ncbi:MAG TPA: L,D-transpeptidase family protein [Flavitalea sp.]|nr:L,D-transpeptidase family protein [Flavitalea sp.]